jgi:hypothetical protein
MEHDAEPEQSEERELIEKQRRNHSLAPLHLTFRTLFRISEAILETPPAA